MKGKAIAALFVWVCVGFNSAGAVQSFLSTAPNIFVQELGSGQNSKIPLDSKVVAMPNGSNPAFEVFFPTKDGSFDASSIPDAVICP